MSMQTAVANNDKVWMHSEEYVRALGSGEVRFEKGIANPVPLVNGLFVMVDDRLPSSGRFPSFTPKTKH